MTRGCQGLTGWGWGWWAGCVPGLVGFVGRERELSRLARALGGDARLVLVVGDAGVGKTRFAQEGMRRAVAGGMVCVFGGCLPLAGELPLLPVADALGELGRLDGGAQLEAALAVAPPYVRAEVARLLPRFGAGVPGPGGRGEGWQREQLFSALAELLGAVAQRSGLAVVVEDVHWADGATLDCLTYLVRAGGGGTLTVVVTCRSDDAPLGAQVAAWLAHTRGRGGVEEIGLGPLTRGEAEQQIAGLAGGPPPAGSPMTCMPARRATRSSLSNWWRRHWTTLLGVGWMHRQGCRTGSRSCCRCGPAGAVVTRGRCWLGWRSRAGR